MLRPLFEHIRTSHGEHQPVFAGYAVLTPEGVLEPSPTVPWRFRSEVTSPETGAGSVALLVMAAVTARSNRPTPLPLVWPFLAHVMAMFPDFLFAAGVAHEPWMDVFLGHINSHFVPGRNVTWFVVFLIALGTYLWALARLPSAQGDVSWPETMP